MNRREALAVLEEELAGYRSRAYANLRQMLDRPESFWVRAPSGVNYQIKVSVFWDSRNGGDLRVLGSVDDGGWRAFFPLSSDFILSPDGTFVGE